MKSILFVDFGSGHHRDAVSLSAGELVMQSGRPRLIEHAGLLADLVAPYPELRIVFSMSSERAYGAKEALPPSLQGRVIGSLYEFGREFPEWGKLSRFDQIMRYVSSRGIQSWLSLEHDGSNWPEELRESVVYLGEDGLDSSTARKEVVEKLAELHTNAFRQLTDQHNWMLDMLAASRHIEAAVQHFELASAAVEPSARYAAANGTILSCGAAIAALYSFDIDKAREASLALTFLSLGLGWGDEKRAAIGQLLKASTAGTPTHSTQICELAEKTLNDTRRWLANEAESHGR